MDDLQPPYPGHLEAVLGRVAREASSRPPIDSPHAGAPQPLRETVITAVRDLTDELVALSHDIHAHPELGYEEHHAVATVAALLEGHGHAVQTGAYGLQTALRSTAGDGSPRIAILAEYDALPGIGHACGHNVICATAVGAYLAAAKVVGEVGGCVELLGTPAEEGGGGKEVMARAGAFDDVDAAIMLHPFGFDLADHPWIGVRTVDAVFHGRAAHASATPFLGRNALDAAVAAYQGLAALRQHMLPTDRVHAVITDGGARPNIVPERAALSVYLRSAAPETLAVLCERAAAIFEGAASMSGTTVSIGWDPTPVYLPVRSNDALTARWAVNQSVVGRRPLPKGVVPGELTGSTDLGNVSVRVPAIHPTLAIAPAGVSAHSVEFAAHARSEAADRGVVDGAVGLALTAIDFLADAELRRSVADEFEAAGGPLDLDALLS